MTPKKGEGLKGVADREASEAEAEAGGKKESEAPPKVWDRSPSQNDVVRADAALKELHARAHDMGPDAVVDALLQVVDVHPQMKVPAQWPGKTEDTLLSSELLAEVGKLLLRGCPKLEVSATQVVWLWRNKKTWTKQGVQVRADARPLTELSSHLARGAVVAIVANYQLFRLLNTRQKIAAIYAALRKVDSEGKIKPPQFSGFFDEIQLFGTGTNETDIHLVRAIEKGAHRDEQLPFAFPPLSVGDPDGEEGEGEDSTKERRVS